MRRQHKALWDLINFYLKSGKLSSVEAKRLKNELRQLKVAANGGKRSELLKRVDSFSKLIFSLIA